MLFGLSHIDDFWACVVDSDVRQNKAEGEAGVAENIWHRSHENSFLGAEPGIADIDNAVQKKKFGNPNKSHSYYSPVEPLVD